MGRGSRENAVPRYDYKCPICESIVEETHSIVDCCLPHLCVRCGCEMHRQIGIVHIEGSLIYPFNLWNIRLPKGQKHITIENKQQHKRVLAGRGLDAPALHVGG